MVRAYDWHVSYTYLQMHFYYSHQLNPIDLSIIIITRHLFFFVFFFFLFLVLVLVRFYPHVILAGDRRPMGFECHWIHGPKYNRISNCRQASAVCAWIFGRLETIGSIDINWCRKRHNIGERCKEEERNFIFIFWIFARIWFDLPKEISSHVNRNTIWVEMRQYKVNRERISFLKIQITFLLH